MSIKVDYNYSNTGWYCPGCGTYHSPDVKTCPVVPSPPAPRVPSSLPGVPYPQPNRIPTTPYPPTAPKDVTYGNRCGQCGLKLSGVMMYVCPVVGCPSGLGSPVMLTEKKDGI